MRRVSRWLLKRLESAAHWFLVGLFLAAGLHVSGYDIDVRIDIHERDQHAEDTTRE